MRLKKKEREFLETFAAVAQKMLNSTSAGPKNGKSSRRRRSAADVAKMKKQIRAARKRNVPVREIADNLGVTTSYIYQISR